VTDLGYVLGLKREREREREREEERTLVIFVVNMQTQVFLAIQFFLAIFNEYNFLSLLFSNQIYF
jgi:hypothetical protein